MSSISMSAFGKPLWASSTPSIPVSVPPPRTKSSIKKAFGKRRQMLNVHFADMSGVSAATFLNNSDGEVSESGMSDGHSSDPDIPTTFTCGPLEDPEETKCLKHLDALGLTLDNTFKEVESLDKHVMRLREEFDQEMMSEHTFMAHICTLRMARAACCKKQLEAWKNLQHELIDFCCHYHHIHDHSRYLSNPSDDLNSVSSDSSDADMDAVLGSLSRLMTFDIVKRRIDPNGNARSFVNDWIIHGEDAMGHHHYVSDNMSSDSTDSNVS